MNLMLPDSGLIFWMTIIFAIVFFILARFGFPVITGMVEKRNRRISDALEAARTAEEAMTHLKQEQERIMAQTRTEQARLLQEAASESEAIIAKAQEKAREDAQKILDDARLRIEAEKEAAMRDVRKEVASLALAVAEKVVRKEMESDEGQKAQIERIMDGIL